MATFISNFARVYSRRLSYRLLTSHHGIASLSAARNVKLMQNQHLQRCLSLSSIRKIDINDETDKPVSVLTQKIAISDQNFPRGLFIGKRGDNIRKLESSCGPGFSIEAKHDCILLFGTDAEEMESASEKVRREIQRIETIAARQLDDRLTEEQDPLNTFSEVVSTDGNAVMHKQICGRLIGKGGFNIQQLQSESGLDFRLVAPGSNHVVVSGPDTEVVNKAVKLIQQEVQRIRDEINSAFEEKLFIDEDAYIHNRICRMIIGKEGKNIQQLKSEIGFDFRFTVLESNHVLVSGPDAEGVNKAVEKVRQEVKRIKEEMALNFAFKEKVFTDEDDGIHNKICRMLIGRDGKNIQQLQSETGFNVDLTTETCGHIIVSGHDAEMLDEAVKRIQQEVQKIKDEIALNSAFEGKVLTDEDANIHSRICGLLIGKEGKNIQQLKSETGLNFDLNVKTCGHIIVSGPDAEMMNEAVKNIQQEVQKIRDELVLNSAFEGKVFTDEDANIHSRICGMIIGKEGKFIQRLKSENGLDFKLVVPENNQIIISGPSAEMVNKAVETVQQEVQKIKNDLLACNGKVLTDPDAAVHHKICGMLIGRGGHNFHQMMAETGFKFQVMTQQTGYVKVLGATDQELNKAVEKVQQQVLRIKNQMDYF